MISKQSFSNALKSALLIEGDVAGIISNIYLSSEEETSLKIRSTKKKEKETF